MQSLRLIFCILLLQMCGLETAFAVRGRPTLNAERTTFVADNGELLRGPFTSSEWGDPAPYAELAKMKNLGFNAVHLYGECLNINYPNGGDSPGYAASRIDSVVNATRDLGMYVVITIGNGANNGNHNREYALDFWRFYAPRYANDTHVIYEIHNEPVAWGPPYSSANANPTGALEMNIDAYNIIRANAPDTPVLLFSYSVLGDSGGANNALTDIRLFNQSVFGTSEATWNNVAVGFHGYAGASANATAVEQIINAGYPCFMTEFATGVWGTEHGGIDTEAVANLERLNVSWLAFHYVPPWGVADDVTRPEVFKDRIDHSGLSWTPDYGSWPVARSVFENGGTPRTIPGFNNNFLSGSLRIQAEYFDNGGNGVAYYNENGTNPGGAYRTDETVGIEAATDSGGGYNVGWTASGDWLEYTMKVSQAGTYNLSLRVASTNAARVQIDAFGKAITENWTLPDTGGLQSWTTATKRVFLEPGQQILRVNVVEGGFNLNWMEFSAIPTGPVADGTYKFVNAGSSLAIDVDAEDNLVASPYTGNANEKWVLQHLGGGQYKVTSAADGWAWDAWARPLHVSQYWWGAAGDRCFILIPADDGFYQVMTAGNGRVFQPSGGDMSQIDQVVDSGGAEQKWDITAPAAPSFPAGLNITEAGTTGANLSWDAVTGADSYKVKRSIVRGGPYTTIASGLTGTSFADSGLNAGTQYFYVVCAVAGGVEGMNSAEVALRFSKLGGSIIGTPGSYNNGGDTIARVFDGNLNTFFDAPAGDGCWAGLNFGSGTTNVVMQIKFCPRSGFADRMVGGVFQGANRADFSDAVTLYTVGSNPAESSLTTVNVSESSGFRYVRYLAPNGSWGNVAEVEFYGYAYTEPVPVPEGLAAEALSSGLVHLTWNATEGATAYRIKRSTESGGPYDEIATVSEGTDFQDDSVVDGVSYYYVVSAIQRERESANSEEAFVFSYPWDTADVGSTLQGSASINNGTFTIEGAGADIWDRSDAFRYVYTEVSGNCTLVARVAGVENTDAWAKGGVMIRKSLAANSANALICVTPGNGISFQWRSTDGAECGYSNSGGLAAPHWVKLVRNGNTFTAYRSVNGTSWTQQGTPQTISMGASVYIGLAVTAHNASLLSTATFDHVTLTATTPSAPASLEAFAESDAQINLFWAASALAETYSIKRSTVSGSDYVVVASNLTETAYDDVSGLSAGTRYYYVVCAMNVGGASADSAEVSAVPSVEVLPNEYHIADCEVAGGANMMMRVTNSVPGHAYQIWATDNLVSPDWHPVGVGLVGSEADLEFNIPMEEASTNRYFKLEVQRQ
ncbi:MAG: carbohydrate-binding protein [Pontiellaceae bacterium]|nr:carbohydrate-binding protein [Pontiellaceae bacterium]MBN2784031.1 carbohydrate-binding protein [Pontiellaceae bacterium]